MIGIREVRSSTFSLFTARSRIHAFNLGSISWRSPYYRCFQGIMYSPDRVSAWSSPRTIQQHDAIVKRFRLIPDPCSLLNRDPAFTLHSALGRTPPYRCSELLDAEIASNSTDTDKELQQALLPRLPVRASPVACAANMASARPGKTGLAGMDDVVAPHPPMNESHLQDGPNTCKSRKVAFARIFCSENIPIAPSTNYPYFDRSFRGPRCTVHLLPSRIGPMICVCREIQLLLPQTPLLVPHTPLPLLPPAPPPHPRAPFALSHILDAGLRFGS